MMGGTLVTNTAQLIAMLCAAGIAACVLRWPTALRRDFLFAFGLFLGGTLIRELVVCFYGVSGWPHEALIWSGTGRLVQIVGAALFVRAALRDSCGEWGWLLVFGLAAFFAGVI